MDDGFRYAIKNKIATEKEYPYTGVDGKCKGESAKEKHVVSEFVDVKPLDSVAFHEAVATTPVSYKFNINIVLLLMQEVYGSNYIQAVFTQEHAQEHLMI